MILALERLPEGRDWVLTNQAALTDRKLLPIMDRSEGFLAEEAHARAEILATLRRIGMAETNLARLGGGAPP